MAGHPADVGGAPVDVLVVQIEDPLVSRRDAGQIAGGRVDDALGLARGPRCVEQIEKVLGVHGLGRAARRGALDEVVPPDVAAALHLDRLARSLEHDDGLDARCAPQRFVRVLLERHRRAPAVAAVGRDHQGRLGVVDPLAHGLGREAAEDHAVGRPDPGARQHRDRKLGHHRHVDRHPVALADAVTFQRGGEQADLAIEVPVGEDPRIARLAFPDQRGLGLARPFRVPVQAVVGHVQLAADEPLGVRRLPLERLLPGREPVQLARALLPELHRVPRGLGIDRLAIHDGVLHERLGRGKLTLFPEERFDRKIRFHLRLSHSSPRVVVCE